MTSPIALGLVLVALGWVATLAGCPADERKLLDPSATTLRGVGKALFVIAIMVFAVGLTGQADA